LQCGPGFAYIGFCEEPQVQVNPTVVPCNADDEAQGYDVNSCTGTIDPKDCLLQQAWNDIFGNTDNHLSLSENETAGIPESYLQASSSATD
jgi:hypothetical protein